MKKLRIKIFRMRIREIFRSPLRGGNLGRAGFKNVASDSRRMKRFRSKIGYDKAYYREILRMFVSGSGRPDPDISIKKRYADLVS